MQQCISILVHGTCRWRIAVIGARVDYVPSQAVLEHIASWTRRSIAEEKGTQCNKSIVVVHGAKKARSAMCSTANNHFVVVSIIRPPFCKNVNMPSAQDFFNRFITGLPTRGTVCFYKCTKQPRRFLINVDEGTRLGRLQNTRAEKNFLAKRSKII